MKSIFTIKGIGLAALLAPIVWLAAGCESMNQLAELGTGIAVATGSISTNEAASITRTTQAVTKTFQDITPEQEYYIGRTVAATVLLGYPPKPAEKLNDYVNLVGQSLAKFSARPETFGGYHFLVLDSDEINAFAAQGGLVLVTRGLLQCCQSEDELASVLAHESGTSKSCMASSHQNRPVEFALTILAVEGARPWRKNLAEVTKRLMNPSATSPPR